MKEIDYIVWDLETTGFVAPEAKILEIGCFVVRGEEVEKRHWVLDNKCEIPENIIEITGITPEIIAAEGRDPKECLSEFLPLFKEAKKNITHNGIRFDIPFLIAYAADLMGYKESEIEAVKNLLRSRSFDTAVFHKSKEVGISIEEGESYEEFADKVMNTRSYAKFNLGLCCDFYGVDRSNIVQHRALADVHLTHCLFKKICEQPNN